VFLLEGLPALHPNAWENGTSPVVAADAFNRILSILLQRDRTLSSTEWPFKNAFR